MAFTLYHAATSVCSQKVRVGLAEMGLPYDSVIFDLTRGDQFDPAYLRINPDGVVPTLVDNGDVLVESSLILDYLDRVHNGGRLMPSGGMAEARARHWLLRCLAIHQAINTLSFSTAMRDVILATKSPEEIAAQIARMPDPVAAMKRRDLLDNGLGSVFVGQALIHLCRMFDDMQGALSAGEWVSGGAFGITDIALVAYVDRLDRLGFEGLWRDRTPRVGGWLAAMKARPSYAAGIGDFVEPGAAERMRAAGLAAWPNLEAQWAASLAAGKDR